MASRGLNCLLSPVNEIDLPVQKRGYSHKTRRPYGALDTKIAHVKALEQQTKLNDPSPNVFGWGDLGEKSNPHVDQKNSSSKTKNTHSKYQKIWPYDPAKPINGPSYPRDNSAILFQRPYRQEGLRPRCWIRTS